MAIKEKADLKKLFETLDKPTQQDFADWLDSFVHVNEYTVVQLIKATIAQAKAGTDNNTYITPLSLLETIRENALVKANNSEALSGTDDVKYTTSKNVKDAFDYLISLEGIPEKATQLEAFNATDNNKYMTPALNAYVFGSFFGFRLATTAEALAGTSTAKYISPATLREVLLGGSIKRTLTYTHTDLVSYTGTVSNNFAVPNIATRLVKIASGVDVTNGIISFGIVVEQGGLKETAKMTIAKSDGNPTIQKDFKSDSSGPSLEGFFVSAADSALKLDIYAYITPDQNNASTVTVSTFPLLISGINLITPQVAYYRVQGQKAYIDSEYYDSTNVKPSVDGDEVIEYYQTDKYSWYRQV